MLTLFLSCTPAIGQLLCHKYLAFCAPPRLSPGLVLNVFKVCGYIPNLNKDERARSMVRRIAGLSCALSGRTDRRRHVHHAHAPRAKDKEHRRQHNNGQYRK